MRQNSYVEAGTSFYGGLKRLFKLILYLFLEPKHVFKLAHYYFYGGQLCQTKRARGYSTINKATAKAKAVTTTFYINSDINSDGNGNGNRDSSGK